MPLLNDDGHLVDLHFEAQLCPECGLPGLRVTSVHVAEGKWRAVYQCPTCRMEWYSFKGENIEYVPEGF